MNLITKSLSSLFTIIFAVVLWYFFAPVQLYGSTSYVILIGNSMEPEFKKGDLVLVKESDQYQEGEIVAYRHPQIKGVFHRIVDTTVDGRFVMKGDHNDWLDSYYPTPDDIVGKYWFHIPSGGDGVNFLRQPLPLAIISVLVAGMIISVFFKEEPNQSVQAARYAQAQTYAAPNSPPEREENLPHHQPDVIVTHQIEYVPERVIFESTSANVLKEDLAVQPASAEKPSQKVVGLIGYSPNAVSRENLDMENLPKSVQRYFEETQPTLVDNSVEAEKHDLQGQHSNDNNQVNAQSVLARYPTRDLAGVATGGVPNSASAEAEVLRSDPGIFSKPKKNEVSEEKASKNLLSNPFSRSAIQKNKTASNGLVEMFFLLMVFAIGFLILAVVSFSRPTTIQVANNIPYTQNGVFSYSANVPEGVYDDTTVEPGEPFFRRLSNSFNVSFHYMLSANTENTPQGLYSMVAEISDVNGWKRTIEIVSETYFTGKEVSISGTIDFSEIQALIDILEKETGISRDEYRLTIRPTIITASTLAGDEFITNFAPELDFSFDDLQVQLLYDTTGGEEAFNRLSVEKFQQEVEQANTVNLFVFALQIIPARIIAIIGLLVMIAGMAFLGRKIYFTLQQGESSRYDVLYGSIMVKVDDRFSLTRQLVSVDSIHELARIAERDQCMIYHQHAGGVHHYYVQSPNTPEITYHYYLKESALSSIQSIPTTG